MSSILGRLSIRTNFFIDFNEKSLTNEWAIPTKDYFDRVYNPFTFSRLFIFLILILVRTEIDWRLQELLSSTQ